MADEPLLCPHGVDQAHTMGGGWCMGPGSCIHGQIPPHQLDTGYLCLGIAHPPEERLCVHGLRQGHYVRSDGFYSFNEPPGLAWHWCDGPDGVSEPQNGGQAAPEALGLSDGPKVDVAAAKAAITALLYAIGEDPTRDGLADTPARVARWWSEFIDYNPGSTNSAFDIHRTDQMVVVSGIDLWSLCEHHLLPFNSRAAIGYITRDRVLGLSKFARIARRHAHGLQIQERLSSQIADEVQTVTGTEDVAVTLTGRHLCTVMRGIQSPVTMNTSIMRGRFRDTPQSREEFFHLANLQAVE